MMHQQPLSKEIPVTAHTGMLASGKQRRGSSSSSSSSDSDAERLRKSDAAAASVKERRAVVDQPAVTAEQKHNMTDEQIQAIRGANYLRRENVREQT
jgi:hypothetical protein